MKRRSMSLVIGKSQISMAYHIRTAKELENWQYQISVRMGLICCWRSVKWHKCFGKLVVAQKIINFIHVTQQLHSKGCLPKRNDGVNKHTTNAHQSFILSSETLETTSDWRNKLWYMHTTEYYSAIKRNSLYMWQHGWISKHYTNWKKSHSKSIYCVILFMQNFLTRKTNR